MFNLVSDIITEYWQGKDNENNEKKETPTEEFKKFCDEEPLAPECKIFDV